MSLVISRADSESSLSSEETEEVKFVSLFQDATNIFILDQSNFDEYIYEPRTRWVVTFYAEWCGWSKRFAPELILASLQLKDIVNLAVVNCAEHRQLKKRFKVNRYPTIFLIDGEGPAHQQAYNGPRLEENLVAFVHKKFDPAVVEEVETNMLPETDANVSSYDD
ncbi:unnamed protein product [Diamesa serratosioi]